MPKVVVPAVLAGALLAVAFSPEARAEVFHDAQVLEAGNFSLGAEGEVLFDPGTNYLLFAHFGVGLGANADLGLKVSFFDDRTYFGGDLQYGLLDDGDGHPALSVWAGGHWIDVPDKRERTDFFGLDAGVVASEDIENYVIYLGYDLDVDFLPDLDRPLFQQRLFGGVRIVVSEHLSFYAEGGYGLKNRLEPTRHYLSAGPTLFF